jgi:hypothetical protein
MNARYEYKHSAWGTLHGDLTLLKLSSIKMRNTLTHRHRHSALDSNVSFFLGGKMGKYLESMFPASISSVRGVKMRLYSRKHACEPHYFGISRLEADSEQWKRDLLLAILTISYSTLLIKQPCSPFGTETRSFGFEFMLENKLLYILKPSLEEPIQKAARPLWYLWWIGSPAQGKAWYPVRPRAQQLCHRHVLSKRVDRC